MKRLKERLLKLMNLLIVGNNHIMIIDEPGNGLDIKTKKHVLKLIDNIRQSRTRTIFIITHDDIFDQVADRSLLMTNGVLIETNKSK